MDLAFRVVCHPYATIPLIALVAIGYLAIGESNYRYVSVIKHLVGDLNIRATSPLLLPSGEIVSTPYGPRARETSSHREEAPVLAWIDFRHRWKERWDPWAYCYERGGSYLEIDVIDDDRMTEEEALDLYLDHVVSRIYYSPDIYTAQSIEEINEHRKVLYTELFWTDAPRPARILWWGVADNVAILLVLAALMVNLKMWVPRVKAMRARHLERNARRCRRCKYPLDGLPTPVCPECGVERQPPV